MTGAMTWGLLAAWAVHDAEELVTMARWLRAARPGLEERFPAVPWRRLEVSQAHVTVAIGLMGGVMAGAAALGARTGGRSAVFRTVLAGFGAHGVGHLAQAAVARGYTPGVVTAPVVVIPFTLWAWRRLRAAGVPLDGGGRTAVAGLAALPVVLGGVHALAHVLTGRRTRRAARPGRDRTARPGRG
ncbi:HXXEE domain-containing protein [Nonomuraea sp. NPDC050783]|uniref:HXXEE domain-containing protein n=1 Tax=Nonomuraea sp. NPDC050783 TaxID=3154634 RepID=UPI0034671F9F